MNAPSRIVPPRTPRLAPAVTRTRQIVFGEGILTWSGGSEPVARRARALLSAPRFEPPTLTILMVRDRETIRIGFGTPLALNILAGHQLFMAGAFESDAQLTEGERFGVGLWARRPGLCPTLVGAELVVAGRCLRAIDLGDVVMLTAGITRIDRSAGACSDGSCAGHDGDDVLDALAAHGLIPARAARSVSPTRIPLPVGSSP